MLVAFCDQLFGNSTLALLERGAFGIADDGVAELPLDLVEGVDAGGREAALDRQSRLAVLYVLCSGFAHQVLLVAASGVDRESLRATRTEPPSVEPPEIASAGLCEGAGELQVRAHVELAQAVQTELADPLRGQLAAAVVHGGLDSLHQALHVRGGNRSLVSRVQQRGAKLGAIERLPFAAPLPDEQRLALTVLIGREPPAAARALAPPAHRCAALGVAALEDPGWRVAAWTRHLSNSTTDGVLLLSRNAICGASRRKCDEMPPGGVQVR